MPHFRGRVFALMALTAALSLATSCVFAVDEQSAWELVWADEFDTDGPAVNTSKWSFEIGYIRNNEAQYYTNNLDNAYVANGHLHITALHAPYDYPGGVAQYTSASIQTLQAFRFGRFEMRARLPPAFNGTWPAFWLLGENINNVGWPLCGEIDVMENVGFHPNRLYGTLHMEEYNGQTQYGNTTNVPDMYDAFVVYAMEWTPERITIFINGTPYLRYDNPGDCNIARWPFNNPFNVKINFAIGGNWGGQHGIDNSMFPATYAIDYLRVYSRPVPPQPAPCTTFFNYIRIRSGLSAALLRRAVFSVPAVLLALRAQLMSDLVSILPGLYASDVGIPAVSLHIPGQTALNSHILVNFSLPNASSASVRAAFAAATANQTWIQSSLAILNNAATSSGWKLSWISTKCHGCYLADGVTPRPLPWRVTGRTAPVKVPMVEYDFGGQSVAYYDTTEWNLYNKNAFRALPDFVDIDLLPFSSPPRYNLGYFTPQEWVRYSSIATPAGSAPASWNVTVLAANGASAPGLVTFTFTAPGLQPIAVNVAVPVTGNWDSFETFTSTQAASLPAGQVFTVIMSFPVPNYGLQWFSLSSA